MSQHGRVEAAEAGRRSIFNHVTPSGAAAHRAEEVAGPLRGTPTSAGMIDKLWEAGLCLGEPVSFAEPISLVCLQSGQEDAVATAELEMSSSAWLLPYSSAWTEAPGDNERRRVNAAPLAALIDLEMLSWG